MRNYYITVYMWGQGLAYGYYLYAKDIETAHKQAEENARKKHGVAGFQYVETECDV